MDELDKIAEHFLLLVSGHLDEHTSRKGFVETKDGEVTLFTPSHIQFAKYGRGKGKMPPVQPLIEWVKQKGLAKGKEAVGMAWGIAKSIAKKGTANHVPNAPNALEEAINKELNDFIVKQGETFTLTIDEEIKEIFENSLKDFQI